MLFDKHERPVLKGMTAEAAWAACEEYWGYVDSIAESGTDEEWHRRVKDANALYDKYYALFE